MTDRETAARGQRAEQCAEFISPILEDVRIGYLTRIAEIASTELNPKARTEKITALSIALKVLGNVTNGLQAVIDAGELAEKNLLRSEEIERLGHEQRRIVDMVPWR